MPRRRPAKPYTGVLLEPRPLPSADETTSETAARWTKHDFDRFPALFEHYGIDQTSEDRWFLLAGQLAQDHVPAFRPPVKAGRRIAVEQSAADVVLLVKLYQAEEAGKSVKNAARWLSRNDPLLQGRDPEHLRQRYYRLRDTKTPESKNLLRIATALKSQSQ